jgi:hypothetical protein
MPPQISDIQQLYPYEKNIGQKPQHWTRGTEASFHRHAVNKTINSFKS